MDYLIELSKGLAVLMQPDILPYLIGGYLIGTFFGAVPGLTSMLAIALPAPAPSAPAASAALASTGANSP